MERDPYGFVDPQLRPIAKLALLIALNARSPRQAIGALRSRIDSSDDLKSLHAASGLKVGEIYRLMKEHHEPIASSFGQDVGVGLMRKDSDLADRILRHFTRKSVPVLPIHDSFIIAAEHEAELLSVMQDVYRDRFGHEIQVERKG